MPPKKKPVSGFIKRVYPESAVQLKQQAFVWSVLFIGWLAINVADIFWIYFYSKAAVYPIPRTLVDRNSAVWTAFSVLLFTFGFLWGLVNIVACICIFVILHILGRNNGPTARSVHRWLDFLVFLPVSILLIIFPFTGGWIVTHIWESRTWNHRCDSYPMSVILDGRSYHDSSSVTAKAYFYTRGRKDVLFTYELTRLQPETVYNDVQQFALRDWNVDQLSIPLDTYPTLQSIQYNFTSDVLSGTCRVPSSPSNFGGSTTTLPCMTGTFDSGKHLFFNITSKVPLNNTANAQRTASTTDLLRNDVNGWAYDSLPAVILQQVDPETNALGQEVLRTGSINPHDCTELKLCISGIGGEEGSVVGADVLSGLGVILSKQSDFAFECTTPSDSYSYN